MRRDFQKMHSVLIVRASAPCSGLTVRVPEVKILAIFTWRGIFDSVGSVLSWFLSCSVYFQLQVEAGHIAFLQEMMAKYKVCAQLLSSFCSDQTACVNRIHTLRFSLRFSKSAVTTIYSNLG